MGQLKGRGSNSPGGGFLKREKVQREGQRCWSFLGLFSDGGLEQGRILRRVILFAWLTWNFYVPSYRQIRNVLDSVLACILSV